MSTVIGDSFASAELRAVPGSAIRELLSLTERRGVLSLAGGLPATELIPTQRIAAAIDHRLADPASMQYGPSAGTRSAREAIAAADGLSSAHQVLLTHGSQQALFLLAHALLDPADLVFVDDPAYIGALQVFAGVRARVEALPITATGLDTDLLAQRLADGARPRLVHTVSSFHNPAAVCLDEARRVRLAALADRYGFWIVDDNPYGRVRFAGVEPTPLHVLSDRVLSLGSASKVLAPALRVGWVSGPPEVIDAVERYRQSVDLCGSTLAHAVVGELMSDEVWWTAHLAQLVDAYSRRCGALIDSLTTHLGERALFAAPQGGMFCWVRVPGVNTTALLGEAVAGGVAYVPGSAFAVSMDAADCMRLSFATLDESTLDVAVARLAAVVAHAAS
ncbi:PLP-dependent aminotransferase family protein [Williamsia sp. CHRR-6]|uniref:aminotransferase-like domain-containing protein n=1 Tax=Williamsia sp. CHRR-6 TaxID=2835871 RepID=UPI001BD97B64|nr:PLP-dependent aminotransferase family protein [Williamsia sp. CHRR-6]MBT0566852.1 PLP-dependent aminotransferase family protein [Williamsia sp. CHRR-6]